MPLATRADRQLACARIRSAEGQDYLKAMAAAANYAWVNRSMMTFLTRQVVLSSGCDCCWVIGYVSCGCPTLTSLLLLTTAQAFAKAFKSSPDELDMQVIYDVSHNIAKVRPP